MDNSRMNRPPIHDRVERPFRQGLVMTLKFSVIFLFIGVIMSMRVSPSLVFIGELSGEPQGGNGVWKWIFVGMVFIAALSFGFSYLGSRIGERKAQWYLFLVLAPPLIALFYWLVHHA